MTLQNSNTIPPTEQQRLFSTIENWKRKLLDISKRNRSLNFKPLRVSTVTVVDELPEVVFSKIWVDSSNMRFAATELSPDSSTGESGDMLDELLQSDEQYQNQPNHQMESSSVTDALAFISDESLYLNAKRQSRQNDNLLQTSLDSDKLDRSLRRLDEQTRSALEEQGVNILFLALGMLHYKDSTDSKEMFQAPLVLLPVELSRKSSRSGYSINASGNEPIINPSLVEYLRHNYGIVLPDLPDAANMDDTYDLRAFLSNVSKLIERQKGWAVTDDIHLALFSFQKFMMYKDIEINATAFALHRLIQKLILRTGPQYDGLPLEIRSLGLDQSLPPENTYQVVDADASQLRAIAAVANNLDLVMEGPPGTGKSQTITNLIALALASGRSVLFVAEKNAALKVVHQRLVKAGLGDFCLELHSTKANKRAVVHELARSLDASLQAPTVSATARQRIPIVRDRITKYVKELHKPFGVLNLSPYQVIGYYDAVIDAPRVKYPGAVETITKGQLDQTIYDLNELAVASELIGDPRNHPWRDTSKSYYLDDDFENIRVICQQILSELENVQRLSVQLEVVLGLPRLESQLGLQSFLDVADVVSRSPGASFDALTSSLWDDTPPTEAIELIRLGRDLQRRVEAINLLFKPSVYDIGHASDIAYINAKLKGLNRFVALFDESYRIIRKRWLDFRLPSFHGSLRVEAEQLLRVDQITADRKKLANQEPAAQQYFGSLWKNETSDWDRLDKYTEWVVEFRKVFNRYGLNDRVVDTAKSPSPDLGAAPQLKAATKNINDLLSSLGETVGWPENYLKDRTFDEIGARVQGLLDNLRKAHQWTAFQSVRTKVVQDPARNFVDLAMDGQVKFADLVPAFQRSFYQEWLAKVIQERKPLLEFNTLLHEQHVNEFKDLDRGVLIENRNRLIRKVRDDIQKKLQESAAIQAMPFLRREIARQRGLSPLRRTLKQAGAAIRAIKPCFMMSPLTVAQLLDSSQPSFDLVIFDEASQLPSEDAVGAISRGKQLVVVGDPKQLPPTNFFGVMNGQISTSIGEDGSPIYEDGESILEELMAAGLATSRLKWHYRSAHESLIHFSNVSFYDSDLYTFPSVEFNNEQLGVSFEYIENGRYEGKGLNPIEARRVVDAVERHAKSSPQLSLGVGTFNLRQQIAIQDEIENRRRLNPELDIFCSQGNGEPFFVKNLENIQGDERDVIFISVTYGKAADGRLRYNFGPINGENGWRRLNVLASRARRRMRVFSSIRAEDISLVGLTSGGARLLRNFLAYAETGQIDQTEIAKSADTESPFEQDVYKELMRKGITLIPQVGVAGYRIDFGVLDDDLPGRFICGLECDGVAYHASETARDRDRLRQQVLEDRGWVIYRIWSTDWFKDRTGQIDRILALIEKTRENTGEAMRGKADPPSLSFGTIIDRIQETIDDPKESNWDDNPESNDAPEPEGYVRPVASEYKLAEITFSGRRRDILDSPLETVARVVELIVQAEGPIHIDEVVDRAVRAWNTRAGKRIVEQVKRGCNLAVRKGLVIQRKDFFFLNLDTAPVRSRSQLVFAPEHIAHEEYREAVLMVLRTGYIFPRNQLANETRAILGFGRTTGTLENLIGRAIDDLISTGIAGDASAGIALRHQ